MKSSFTVAAIASVASASLIDGMHTSGQDFMDWGSMYGKSYTSTKELVKRADLFQKSCNEINRLNENSQKSGRANAAVFGHNFTSDMTPKEYNNMMGFQAPLGSTPNYFPPEDKGDGRRLAARATAIDHAASQKIGPVKDQGGCGSCWTFASNTALEGTIALQKGLTGSQIPHISEQHVVDCTLVNNEYNKSLFDKDYGMYGCNGGWMVAAWTFQKEQGMFLEGEYPYTSGRTGRETKCKHKDLLDQGVQRYGYVTKIDQSVKSIESTKEHLKDKALTIAVDAGGSVFQYYKSGVIGKNDGCGTNLNHAVVLVGYSEEDDGSDDGDDGNNPDPVEECKVKKWWHTCKQKDVRLQKKDANGNHNYWKIQNSWSRGWGDEGFILFEIADGAGVCGMNSYIEYAEA